MDKNLERKNKILAFILVIIALISVAGAIIWFNMYAPLILN
jgi:hypothetical protein